MTFPVLVAVSLPRHPATGNVFRAPQESAALALALGTGLPVEIVHAGPDAEGLEVWAGFGAPLVHLSTEAPISALVEKAHRAAVVLMGMEAALGLGSGLFPYAVAGRLGWPVLAPVVHLAQVETGGWQVETRLEAGRRAQWHVAGQAILTVGPRGPAGPLPRFSEARHARLDIHPHHADPEALPRFEQAARRAVHLPAPSEGAYDARIRALLFASGGGGGRVLEGDPEQLAQDLLDELRRYGLIQEDAFS